MGQVARCHNRHRRLHDGREGRAMMLYRAREDRYERLRYAGARQSSSRGLPAAGRWCCSDIFPWPTGRALLGPASDDLHQSKSAVPSIKNVNEHPRQQNAGPVQQRPANPQTGGDLQRRYRRRTIAKSSRSRRQGAGGGRRLRRCCHRDDFRAGGVGALDEWCRRWRGDGALSRP